MSPLTQAWEGINTKWLEVARREREKKHRMRVFSLVRRRKHLSAYITGVKH
jgi:hypothetical protein